MCIALAAFFFFIGAISFMPIPEHESDYFIGSFFILVGCLPGWVVWRGTSNLVWKAREYRRSKARRARNKATYAEVDRRRNWLV